MKAFQIDPRMRLIREVEYDGADFHAIYPLISWPGLTVDTFDAARIFRPGYPPGHVEDAVFVDDEGLIDWQEKDQQFFLIEYEPGRWRPLAGMGLWTGTDEEGSTIDPYFTLEQVQASVRFVTWAELARFVEDETP